ncbi:acyltransferase [Mycolicibacterium sp.]|uniref:acyltransferase family protein n=1 Tax=Mycolicibacterium sp. TaxID=2320850 RepID=UPI001DFAAC8B|nr:acyltransferase [Mycolicibacterium sp.]MCB1291540.1 acyltransferase [Mycobacterium sp.]MCB9411218.1 acyltransferase [Mycolicibacterium sp.]
MTVSGEVDQGGLEAVSAVDRVPALTGVRALAAMLVVATHAAYTTGKYTHGFVGLVYSRMEIGVPIFFVLSGYLLFGPWVRAAASGAASPPLTRYAWHRVRRIMPAYVVTVLAAYLVYHFRDGGPNPGHTWWGLFRNLTLTQIYTDNYAFALLHQGLTQMWSLAVEVAFYVALPVLAWLLMVLLCRRRWRPVLLLAGLGGLALLSLAWIVLVHITDFLPDGAKLWLPGYLIWFLGGMMLTVLSAMGVRVYGFLAVPLAAICYLIVCTPIAGEPQTSPTGLAQALVKMVFYAVIATLVVAPLALGDRGAYARLLASRPMVWLGEISYEIFLVHLVLMEVAMTEVLHWRVYTGSMPGLFLVTMVLTIPVAWVLHRFTRVRS